MTLPVLSGLKGPQCALVTHFLIVTMTLPVLSGLKGSNRKLIQFFSSLQ